MADTKVIVIAHEGDGQDPRTRRWSTLTRVAGSLVNSAVFGSESDANLWAHLETARLVREGKL